jgi:pyruvate dehydrogenase E1 component alpha subunit
VELLTYRFLGHSKSDRRVYRTPEEEASWRARDPIVRLRERLAAAGVAPERIEAVDRETSEEIETAYRKAAAAPVAAADVALGGVFA